MRLTDEDIRNVERSVNYFRAVNKGVPPPLTTWEDLQQDVFVKLLGSEAYDESRGPRGLYIFEVTKDRFRNACRPPRREVKVFYSTTDGSGVTQDPLSPDDFWVTTDAEDFLASLAPEVQEALRNQRNGNRPPRQSKEERTHDRLVQKARKALAATTN